MRNVDSGSKFKQSYFLSLCHAIIFAAIILGAHESAVGACTTVGENAKVVITIKNQDYVFYKTDTINTNSVPGPKFTSKCDSAIVTGNSYGCFDPQIVTTFTNTANTAKCDIQYNADGSASVTNPKKTGKVTFRARTTGLCNGTYIEISKEGTIDVKLPPDDDSSCSKCIAGGGAGSPPSLGNGGAAIGSADFRLNLGLASMFDDGGFIWLYAETPSVNLATPAALTVPFQQINVQVVTNSDGVIQQVKTPIGLVNVVSNSPYLYQLQVFSSNCVTGTSAPYGTNCAAFVTWTVQNPDTNVSYNRLWVTEQRPGMPDRQFQFTYSNTSTQAQRWDLLEPDGVTTISKWLVPNATNSAITNYISQTSSGVTILQQKCETKLAVPVIDGTPGDGLLTLFLIDGFGAVTQTTSSVYYPTNAATGSANMLQRVDYPDGGWEYYIYDGVGRIITNYSTYANNPPPGLGTEPSVSADHCKMIVYTYDDTSATPFLPYQTTVSFPVQVSSIWQPQEVSRNYFYSTIGFTDEEQCPLPGAAQGASGNLVTLRYFYTDNNDLISYGRVKSVSRPDGTAIFYTYQVTNDTFVTSESTGEPDDWSGPSAIVDGKQTVTTIDNLGRLESILTKDILSNVQFSQEIYTYSPADPAGRDYNVVDLGGRTNQFQYACCGLDTTIDPDGVSTLYGYDSLRRQVSHTVLRGGSGIETTNGFDGLGRTLIQTRIGEGGSTPIVLKQYAYDALGRVSLETNALGGVTTYSYGTVNYQTYVTNNYPDGGNRTQCNYRDGQLQMLSGTAVFPIQYYYGVDQDAGGPWRQYTLAVRLDGTNGTNEWSKEYFDGAGRPYKAVFSSQSGNPSSTTFFNTNDLSRSAQVIKKVDADGVVTLFDYDGKGNQVIRSTDMNQDGYIDYSGLDRITMITNDVAVDHGVNVMRTSTYLWPSNSGDVAVLVSTAETATNGLSTWQTTWVNGVAVTSQSTLVYGANGYRYETNTAQDGSYTTSVYQYGRLISTTRLVPGPVQIGQTTYGYDAHGRQNTIADARNGTTTYLFNNADQVNSIVTPVPAIGQSSETTVSYFDSMGRNIGQLLPDGTSTTNLYYPNGLVALNYGSRTFPVGYSYDAQGRMKTMTNWSGYPNTGARVTTWNYDIYRGILTNKAYDITNGPTYTYTPAGRLSTRVWARGVTTSYNYDHAGGLTNISYSDGATSSVTNIYDRLGRVIQVGASNQVCQYQYDLAGNLLVETNTAGLLVGLAITNGYDQFMRRTNLTARGSGILSQTSYGYTNDSRLFTVSDGTNNATYSYLANSPLVSQITFKSNGVTAMTTIKQYDYLNRLTQISNAPSASPAVAFNYSYNSANQRTQDTLADGSYWVYQYDSLGQVTSGKKYWRDGTPVAGQQFEYGFDDIGNRKQIKFGGDDTGANLLLADYTNNTLNQIIGRYVPSYVDIMGIALATNTVTVNGLPAYRKGEYFWKELGMDNSAAAVWASITNASPGQTSIIGSKFLPKTNETFYYDADGNLTNDGRWLYTWDGENRLVKMSVNTNVGPQYQLLFTYDAKGRRIQKFISTNSVASYTNKLLYDGWNLVAELNPANGVIRSYAWGLDLSGTPQGAGGVGGLLMVSYQAVGTTNCYAGCNGNGDVALLTDATGTSCASYEYGPFGEVIRANCPMAKANPFRFSTKYQDDESDLLYYGYRCYKAPTGTWLSRDPLNEQGFNSILGTSAAKRKSNYAIANDYFFKLYSMRPFARQKLEPLVSRINWDAVTITLDELHQKEDNLYLFVGNDPISNFDVKGLDEYICAIVCDNIPAGLPPPVVVLGAVRKGHCVSYHSCCVEAENVFCTAFTGSRDSWFFAYFLAQFDYERCILKKP